MRKTLLFGIMMVSFNLLNAQTQVDIVTGSGYANDIFYSMENGEVSAVPRTNWDIAFITAQFSISALTNGGALVDLYTYPGGNISAWSTLDTTGMDWVPMYNSLETWEEGAFTRFASGHPDYGWGIYNMSTHVITGDSLYVIKTVGGNYKKFWLVDKNAIQNTWTFKFANLDGSDEYEETINGGDYSTKNFVYYSIDSTKVIDREPASESWDLLFTKYFDYTIPYSVTGLLSNEYQDIKTLEVRATGMQQDTAATYDKNLFTTSISTIGSDWKKFDMGAMGYTVSDSTVYYIKKQVENTATYWKIYFTAFDYVTGTYSFIQTQMEQAVSNGPEDMVAMVEIFPNPANDYIQLVYDATGPVDIHIYDTSGKLVYSELTGESGFSKHMVDISALESGIYFVNVRSGNKTGSLKFIKE